MDIVAAASAKMVDHVDKTQQEIIFAVNDAIGSNKADLSVVDEIRSLLKDQEEKIASLTTMVNGQGTRLQALTNRVNEIPTSPLSLSNGDRALLESQADLLNSHRVLIN